MTEKTARSLAVINMFLLLVVPLSSAAVTVGAPLELRFTAPGAQPDDDYGSAIAYDDGRVLVGADGDDGARGRAFLYERNALGVWSERVFTPIVRAAGDGYGSGVALEWPMVIVGAPGDDFNGSVYVHERQTNGLWTVERITASDGAAGDRFGAHVAVDGGRILVAAPGDDDNGLGSGSVYLFTPGTSGGWVQTKFTAAGGAAGDAFGSSLAFADGAFAVGAPGHDGVFEDTGRVHLFRPAGSGWTETVLKPSDPTAEHAFGTSVALSGGSVLVGAPGDRERGAGSGSVYLHEPDGAVWTVTELHASDASNGDALGTSVALAAGVVYAGAEGDDDAGSMSGSVYSFSDDGDAWVQTKVASSDASARAYFGRSILFEDGDLLVAAPGADGGADDGGAAYLYVRDQDADDLGDLDEDVHGTNPLDPDSDDDGLYDGTEVHVHGTDPLSNDTDGDGLHDIAEISVHGTDPLLADTDGDGLGDGAELLVHGTDPLVRDTDEDWYSDGVEVDCGSDPLDRFAFPLPICALPDELPF